MSYFEYSEATSSTPLPDRLYACVDSIESAGQSAFVTYSSVDADWFDEWILERPGNPQFAYIETPDEIERRVSAIEIEYPSLRKAPREGGWFELHLKDGPTADAPVIHYLSLYGPGISRTLVRQRPIRGDRRATLKSASSMARIDDASETDLRRALTWTETIEAAGVYDVGQGGCNGLIGGSHYPLIYFDLGGGVHANAGTFPSALDRFCFTGRPPIVLSHFDADHWSSANRDPRALGMTWVVPRQSLRPTQAAFLRRLVINGEVLVWGDATPPITVGQISVGRCTGTGINNSGLSLMLSGPDGKRMLFPGDAKYELTPHSVGEFCSLVAAHHGGRATTAAVHIPRPDGDACGRLVYTYGPGNSYNHPLASSKSLHRNWSSELHTADRKADLGHVHLYWDTPCIQVHPACGGTGCSLFCRQH